MTARSTCWAALLPMPPPRAKIGVVFEDAFSTGASNAAQVGRSMAGACMERGGMLKPLPGICAALGWTPKKKLKE